MGIDHIWPRKKCFKCGKYGHIAKHCKSVNVIGRSAEHTEPRESSLLEMWGVGSYPEGLPKESETVGSRPGKLASSNHTEANGESIIDANNRVDNMLTYRIELAGNPNSCIIKINNQKCCALLDSGAEVL